MPCYFFDRNAGSAAKDTEGTELANLGEARLEAILHAAETLKDHPSMLWSGGDLEVTVTDETGGALFRVKVSATDLY